MDMITKNRHNKTTHWITFIYHCIYRSPSKNHYTHPAHLVYHYFTIRILHLPFFFHLFFLHFLLVLPSEKTYNLQTFSTKNSIKCWYGIKKELNWWEIILQIIFLMTTGFSHHSSSSTNKMGEKLHIHRNQWEN
mgnify:CR=1 FL=1